ncbi:potassium channel subfamily K member 13-like [Schistocerca gregaria]|uniref:potassium channel subfamily K member 13-like n=1 Tax=Schistocerca gregaria TaxID=7010 RepID=UPI00211ED9DE|nr:potassium channel subfamily K member 13-like [Schistocerca gregaria]
MERVHRLLYAYGNASAAGIIHKRRRWDFAGSFHFVGTIVSTIGYGNTTPQTTAGKAVVILYGFLGCSGGILFFNLFLERIITLLACGLRALHLRRLRRRVAAGRLAQRRISGATMAATRRLSRASLPSQDYIDDDIDDSMLDNWKPSVYWVMLYLAAASVCVASCAAAVYSPVEDWSFFEALYFCFVSFATIGFGDYVTTQEPDYPHVHWYRFGNFVFLVLGCCCIYSLFNVTSIVIKQFLNWLIVKLACRGVCGTAGGPRRPSVIAVRKGSQRRRRSSSVRGRRRSSAGLPQNLRRPPPLAGVLSRGAAPVPVCSAPAASSASDADSDTEAGTCGAGPRRLSGELISMKEFLRANKVSLAVMQKQLYETAQMSRAGCGTGGSTSSTSGGASSSGRFVPGTVGPLAMLSQKLDTSGR